MELEIRTFFIQVTVGIVFLGLSLLIKRPNSIMDHLSGKNLQTVDFIKRNEFTFQVFCLVGSLPYMSVKMVISLHYLYKGVGAFLIVIGVIGGL